MMKCKATVAALSLFLYAGLSGMASAADWVLVAGAKSSVRAVDAETAANLYLGKVSELPGVGPVQLHDLPEGNAVRDGFYQEAANKSASAMKALWSRMIFTGKGQPPKAVENSAALKKILASNPTAIGYIEKSAVDASVKVLLSM